MEKIPRKMGKHIPGLSLGETPPAFAAQQEQMTQVSDKPKLETSDPGDKHVIARPMKTAKLTCKEANFVLTLPVYDVEIQEQQINLLVMAEFSLRGDPLEFLIEVEDKSWHVKSIGVTVNFRGWHAIVFFIIPEDKP
jgi:hypothetical protein